MTSNILPIGQSKKEKVLIGIPYFDRIEKGCEQSIFALLKDQELAKQFSFTFTKAQSALPPRGRNQLFNSIKEHDYFLGVDADIKFTPQDFLSLYNRKKKIVFGAYKLKTRDVYDCGGFNPQYSGVIDVRLPINSTGLIKVDWAGTGFFLAQTSLIQNIGKPWFTCPVIKTPDSELDIASEDIAFCMKLTEHKVDIYVDCDVSIEHLIREDEVHLLLRQGIIPMHFTQPHLKSIVKAIKKLPYEEAEPIIISIEKQLTAKG
jgi:hypothetical protein